MGYGWLKGWLKGTSLLAQMIKNLLAVQKTRVRSLCQEERPEEEMATQNEMATHSTILAGRIPWTEEPGGLQSRGHEELDLTE